MEHSADVAELLHRWQEVSQEIAKLEEKRERYKSLATRLMDRSKIDTLHTPGLTLSRRNITRASVSKRDLPKSVWDQYSRSVSYQAFYLRRN